MFGMPGMFGWKNKILGNRIPVSYLHQSHNNSCVPTCIAMLTWNLSYGVGTEYAATREAYRVAGRDSFVAHRTNKDMMEFYSKRGLALNDVDELIKIYGYRYEKISGISQESSSAIANLNSSARSVAESRLGNMRHNDAMLVIGYNGTHFTLLYKKNENYIFLDPRNEENCGAFNEIILEKKDHQEIGFGYKILTMSFENGLGAGVISDLFYIPSQNIPVRLINSKIKITPYLKDDWF